MPQDDIHMPPDTVPTEPRVGRSIFDIPAPLRLLFDRFPLVTYAANELPRRAPQHRQDHVLHVFTTIEEASREKPSFNPGCLKWQAYLKFARLDFRVVPSNNHASPSGALPFLQSAETHQTLPDPIASNRLKKWLSLQGNSDKTLETLDLRYETYASLLDSRIRKAWLFQLYLCPENINLMRRLYVSSCTSQPLVQWSIAQDLRSAAETELIKSSGRKTLSALDLIKDAEEAFNALSIVLGTDRWFFGQSTPGLFDASVFAYTNLILDNELGWEHNPLKQPLSKHDNLVQHQKRILQEYFEQYNAL